jgi:leucyl aminopeptidase (aminopeptidase T)
MSQTDSESKAQLQNIIRMLRIPLQLNAESGDKLLIITDTEMDPLLWQGLSAAARQLDIDPTVTIMSPRSTHAQDPVNSVRLAAFDPETDLCVYLTSTALAHAPITDELTKRGKRYILMEELTREMLAPDGPGGADYEAMNVVGERLAAALTQGEQIRVTSPNGTDLTASIKGRPGRSITARFVKMSETGGGGCAFPDGECHICPVEGTGEGRIAYDLAAHSVGKIVVPIVLTVERGMVTNIEGGREAAIWRDILEKHGDPNSYNCPAEIAIGLNPNVQPTGILRSDKKKYATSHIGIGDTITLGGTCHANLRLEGVIDQPQVSVDGVTLTEGGQVLV